jgi:hypothetical protein
MINPAIPGCVSIMTLLGGSILIGMGVNDKNKTKHDVMIAFGSIFLILSLLICIYLGVTYRYG